MDGRSIAHLLLTDRATAPAPAMALIDSQNTNSTAPQPWRTAQLVE